MFSFICLELLFGHTNPPITPLPSTSQQKYNPFTDWFELRDGILRDTILQDQSNTSNKKILTAVVRHFCFPRLEVSVTLSSLQGVSSELASLTFNQADDFLTKCNRLALCYINREFEVSEGQIPLEIEARGLALQNNHPILTAWFNTLKEILFPNNT